MKNLVMFLGAVLLVGAAACSSSSSSDGSSQIASGNCESVGATSKCSADAPATQSDVDTCNKGLSDATCGSKYKDVLICIGTNQTCAADNTTDEAATEKPCATQLNAYSSCVTGVSTTDAGS